MEIKEIRKSNFNALCERYGRSDVAQRMGYGDTAYVNQLCGGHGSFGSGTARKIEAALDLPNGHMDVLQSEESLDPMVASQLSEMQSILNKAKPEALKQILEFARYQSQKESS